ncbi:uncharacterized protein LOC121877037 isoform X1 [Homarus americanus]|nr:uncharacterized protein LOC121877037 isoform X1 [Homarus americanus]XP_042238581.1 uncharacterized protein LOC121877037 isoform X1 [Homarus americanus]XP_042238582.1 uncharacterized protein LOC121877037 isoform X1 [Homarus americanus]XP_042238583.1 uncharacterized protein LOC121877037 isoform X1 [Homarus americanus]
MPRKRGSDLSRLSKAAKKIKQKRKAALKEKREKQLIDIYKKMQELQREESVVQSKHDAMAGVKKYMKIGATCRCREIAKLFKDRRKNEQVRCLPVIKREAPENLLKHSQPIHNEAEDGGYSNVDEDPLVDKDQLLNNLISFVEVKPEPLDDIICGDAGDVPSLDKDHLSINDNNSVSSCMCSLYESVVGHKKQIRRTESTGERRRRRGRQLERLTEEQRQAKQKEDAIAKRSYRKRKLQNMTEEQQRAHHAAEAEAQRLRRHLRMKRMTEEQLKGHRAAQAASKRRKYHLQKQTKSENELQMHHTVKVTLQKYHKQASIKKNISSSRIVAAKTTKQFSCAK